jgi:hypothetical protein
VLRETSSRDCRCAITLPFKKVSDKTYIAKADLLSVVAMTGARDIIEAMRSGVGQNIRIFDTEIPHSVRAAECSGKGVSILPTMQT